LGDFSGSNALVLATNKSYEKFINQTGNQAQWANNLLEARESIGMIESRAFQLTRSLIALRKGQFSKAITTLGVPDTKPLRNKLSRAKSVGNQWLELHFGWVPAIEDIHNSVETLSKTDFGSRHLKSSGSVAARYQARSGSDVVFSSVNTNLKVRANHRGSIQVSNPNAFLANQMGVVNPLSVAWEAVPYSFVVDWFTNVGQCLSAMTDFVGLNLDNAFTTYCIEGSGSYEQVHFADLLTWTQQAVQVQRLSFQGPSLVMKPFKGFSVIRGATAISLLLQHL
jgi:hypothetical protein